MQESAFDYEDHLLAFIDVLGYKSILLTEEDDYFEGFSRKQHILEQQYDLVKNWPKNKGDRINDEGKSKFYCSLLSDTIVISIPTSQICETFRESDLRDMIYAVADIQANFCINGFLTRGAIVEGKIWLF